MNVVVFGSGGQLGNELARANWPSDWVIRHLSRAEVDISSDDVARAVTGAALVINAAAYTAVDKAETDAEQAYRVNRDGPANIGRACQVTSAAFFHISTDYVFDGSKPGAYVEDDPTAPLGVYGRSKLEGEQAVRAACERHVILRTSWVVSAFGQNFVKTILRLARERDELRVVADQWGRPTPAADLAAVLCELAKHVATSAPFPWGTYHFAAAGRCSWHELAAEVVELQSRHTGRHPRVTAIPTTEYPTPARRPANSELATDEIERVFGIEPRSWRIGVAEIVNELQASSETR
jgi:dTDP-4-dehydrorhamnose reductase